MSIKTPGAVDSSAQPTAEVRGPAPAIAGNRRAHWQMHKLLLWRIATAALLIAALLAALVYVVEQQRLRDVAVDLAAQRAAQFAVAAGDAFGASGAVRPDEVQARLDRFVQGRLTPREGGIVAARIFAANGKELARFAHPQYAHGDAARDFLDTQTRTGHAGEAVDIAGKRHFFVRVPVRGAGGESRAELSAVFAPSELYLAELRARLWRTVAAAIAIVLITAATLYPIILRLMRRVTTLSDQLLDANLEMLSVVGSAIAKRDADTDAHNYRVAIYSVRLAEAVGLDTRRMQALIKGAFLHDVGKIGIPDHILLKPGKLDEAEFAEMQKHVAHGLDIVQRAAWLADAEAVVGCHHEKYDGRGYGGQLKAEDIPLIARIFAIADVFDALTSHRPYKEALSFEATMDILERSRGTHFDPRLLDAFAGIARALHATFAHCDDDHPRQVLREIVVRYFKQDLASLL